MMTGMFFKLFLSLGLGYVLCVIAAKQKGLLKTVGYTLGISIMALSLLCTLLCYETGPCRMSKKDMKHHSFYKKGGMMPKACPMSKMR